MTLLSVNVNKIALLRNSRGGALPSVTKAAQTAIDAGAQGITVHPRPDGRHIRRQDVYDLAEMLTVEFNIEGNPTPPFLELVEEVKPAQCTLVPDLPEALTSDHGWNLNEDMDRLAPVIERLKHLGIRVSLFLDPDEEQVRLVERIGADRIELYTEAYARAFERNKGAEGVAPYTRAAAVASELGLGVNAGHDLNLKNLGAFCQAVPHVLEVSIGHALINDALYNGLSNTVAAYAKVLRTVSAA
ncbi:MAG: pyridoxine 5'-phosphate synthase [Candidatus Hydrogenedentes bacterium]|nr:pyridoxine 5'-phosphate synthase [Candidatus Hydrogenedentota bacterium]